jgi:hypothetical protein
MTPDTLYSLIKVYDNLRIDRTVNSILKTIDMEQFQKFQVKYRDVDPAPGYSKYLDIRYWLRDNLNYVYRLKLNRSTSLKILDLGTGCGYFPYLCQYFGHSVVTVDMDEIPMYSEITGFLKLHRKIWKIKAFEKLPDFNTRFDLITAFAICFNNHNRPGLWGVDEWSFFLIDLATNQLTESGRIFLKLNAERENGFYDDQLLNYFTRMGAKIDGRYIYFDSLKAFT